MTMMQLDFPLYERELKQMCRRMIVPAFSDKLYQNDLCRKCSLSIAVRLSKLIQDARELLSFKYFDVRSRLESHHRLWNDRTVIPSLKAAVGSLQPLYQGIKDTVAEITVRHYRRFNSY
jgi:hypothetical protein